MSQVTYCIYHTAKFSIMTDQDLLFFCCKSGNLRLTVDLLKSGVDHRCRDENGLQPLHYLALASTDSETAEFLLKDSKLSDVFGETSKCKIHDDNVPLHVINDNSVAATHKGVLDRCKKGATPLHLSCMDGCVPLVNVFLKTSSEVHVKDTFGNSAAHYACLGGNLPVLQELIEEQSFEAQETNKDDASLLHLACISDKGCGIIKYLVDKQKCPLKICDKDDLEPIHYAVKEGSVAILSLLSEKYGFNYVLQRYKSNKNCPFYLAASCGQLDIIKYLLETHDVKPFHRNSKTLTAMEVAALHGHKEVVLHLLALSKEMINDDKSLLLFATAGGNIELIKILVETYHYNPKYEGDCGFSAFLVAFHYRRPDIIEYFVQLCPKWWKRCKGHNNIRTSIFPLDLCISNLKPQGDLTSAHTMNKVLFYLFSHTERSQLIDESCFEIVTLLILKGNKPIPLSLFSTWFVLHAICKFGTLNDLKYLIFTRKMKFHKVVCKKLVKKYFEEIFGDQAETVFKAEPVTHITCRYNRLDLLQFLVEDLKSGVNSRDSDGNTALHIACLNKNDDIIHYLTEKCHCRLDIANNKKLLPIHLDRGSLSFKSVCSIFPLDFVCANGSLQAIRYFLKKDVFRLNDYITRKKCDMNLLHIACRCAGNYTSCQSVPQGNSIANMEMIKTLLELTDLNPFKLNSSFDSPFCAACRDGNLPLVQLFLEAQHEGSVIKDDIGDSPLHVACHYNQIGIIKKLAKLKYYCQTKNNSGDLPLHIACDRSLEAVKLVSDCDIYTLNNEGDTPLHIACKASNLSIIKYLCYHKKCKPSEYHNPAIFDDLRIHVACNDVSLLKLLATPANVNNYIYDDSICSPANVTPLHQACYHSNCDAIEFLVQKMKCFINIPVIHKLPLHIACINSLKLAIIEMLYIKESAIENCQPFFAGTTALHLAVAHHPQAVELLLKCGSDPFVVDESREMPLHIACRVNNFQAVKLLLLNHNPEYNINLTSIHDESPLDIAISENAEDIIELLLEDDRVNKADAYHKMLSSYVCGRLSVKFIDKLTPIAEESNYQYLETASEHGLLDVLKYLIEKKNFHPHSDKFNLLNFIEFKTIILYNSIDNKFKIIEPNIMLIEYLLNDCNIDPIHSEVGGSPIENATQADRADIVKLMIPKMPNLLNLNRNGDSLLHIACRHWSINVVKLLVEEIPHNKSMLLSARNYQGELPLHLACSRSFSLVKLVSGCDVNAQDEAGRTPLHIACMGSIYVPNVIKYLIKDINIDCSIQDKDGNSALQTASSNKGFPIEHFGLLNSRSHFDWMIFIKELKSKFNRQQGGAINVDKFFELFRSIIAHILEYLDDDFVIQMCSSGHLGFLEVLHEQTPGIFTSISDSKGNSILHKACANGQKHIVKYIMEQEWSTQLLNKPNQLKEVPLHIACKGRYLSIVRQVSIGDVNATDNEGNTALHISIEQGNWEFAYCLIRDRKCDMFIENNLKTIPIEMSCNSSRIPENILQLYISKCLQKVYTKFCLSIAHAYIKNAKFCSIKPLVFLEKLKERCGLNPSLRNADGELLLHAALKRVSEYKSKLLLKIFRTIIPSEPNQQFNNGNTLLHFTCLRYKKLSDTIFSFLLDECKCDANIPNEFGVLPIHLVANARTSLLRKLCDHTHDCNSATCSVYKYYLIYDTDPASNSYSDNDIDIETPSISSESPLRPVFTPKASLRFSDFPLRANIKLFEGDTALHIACRNLNIGNIKYLFDDLRCNVNIQNADKETPLHLLLERYNDSLIKIVERMILHADCCLQNIRGDTVLHLIYRYDLRDLAEFFYHHKTSESYQILSIANSAGLIPLHYACVCKNSIEMAKKMAICKSTNVRAKEYHYLRSHKYAHSLKIEVIITIDDTPLHVACRLLDAQLIQLIIEENAQSINIQNKEGDTPLHVLLKAERVEHNYRNDIRLTDDYFYLIAFFHMHGCDFSIKDSDGNSFLHLVSRSAVDIPNTFHLIFASSYDHTATMNNSGEYPLHVACTFNKGDFVSYLFQLLSKCDINKKSKNDKTPLYLALENRNYALAEFLMTKLKSDLSIYNAEKFQPLHMICDQVLIDSKEKLKYCELFASDNVNCDLNAVTKDEHENTALHLACKSSDASVVSFLIELGCDQSIANSHGELPLHIACRNKHDILSLFKFSDVNARNKLGNTPLHLVMSNHHLGNTYMYARASFLINEMKCDLSIANEDKETALHIACQCNLDTNIIKMLCGSANYDINSRNCRGNTPLHELYLKCTEIKSYSMAFESQEDLKRTENARYLIDEKNCDPNMINKKGETVLHIVCKRNNEAGVRFLLSLKGAHFDLSQPDHRGNTPLMLTTNGKVMRLLINNGADSTPIYEKGCKFFSRLSLNNSPTAPLKILVIGNASSGKTTLIQSLKAEGKPMDILLSEEQQHTAGIIPNSFRSDIYGSVTFFDFAGQRDFYAGHEAFIHNVIKNSPPLILLLVNLCESPGKIKEIIDYWICFLKHQCNFKLVKKKPVLLIIGSHLDLKGENKSAFIEYFDKLKRNSEKNIFSMEAAFTMDCRKSHSDGIDSLRKNISDYSDELRDKIVFTFTSHLFLTFLSKEFNELPVVSFSQVTNASKYMKKQTEGRSSAQETELFNMMPTDEIEIARVCKELDDNGQLLFLEHPKKLSQSWIVLDIEMFSDKIMGVIMAPPYFKQYKFDSTNGIISLSEIASAFKEYDPYMLISFLTKLEFCHEIKDEEVLKQVHTIKSINPFDRFFFFPALVRKDSPPRVWITDGRPYYQCCWLLECKDPDEFFTPRFMQLVILRLLHSLALGKMKRRKSRLHDCHSFWRNGLKWCHSDVEVLVEFTESHKRLIVMMKTCKGTHTPLKCAEMRSSIISLVLNLKEEVYSSLETVEYFVHPSSITHPLLSSADKLKKTSMRDLSTAVVNSDESTVFLSESNECSSLLSIQELLYFEPYSSISDDECDIYALLKKDGEASDEFLYELAESFISSDDEMQENAIKILKFIMQPKSLQLQSLIDAAPEGKIHEIVRIFQSRSCEDQSIQTLKKMFDKYSVFVGRNPADLL